MINVPYTLEFSQCSQGLLEWKVVGVSRLLLSVSWLSFSVSLSLSWVPSASLPFSEATSSSSLLHYYTTQANIATKWIYDGSWQSFIEYRGEKTNKTSGRSIENNRNVVGVVVVVEGNNRNVEVVVEGNNRNVVAVVVVEENNRNVVGVVVVVVEESNRNVVVEGN